MRLYTNRGDIYAPMTGRGKKPILHESVELALSYATLLYIQLKNYGMNKIPDCMHLIQKMKLCLNGGAYTYKRYDHLYYCIMRTIYDQVDVSGDDYRIKQRRLIWTTYRNINKWFET